MHRAEQFEDATPEQISAWLLAIERGSALTVRREALKPAFRHSPHLVPGMIDWLMIRSDLMDALLENPHFEDIWARAVYEWGMKDLSQNDETSPALHRAERARDALVTLAERRGLAPAMRRELLSLVAKRTGREVRSRALDVLLAERSLPETILLDLAKVRTRIHGRELQPAILDHPSAGPATALAVIRRAPVRELSVPDRGERPNESRSCRARRVTGLRGNSRRSHPALACRCARGPFRRDVLDPGRARVYARCL